MVDVPLAGPCPSGQPSAAGGRAAAEAVQKAAAEAMAGTVDGLVTAPLNKESLRSAGYPWPGHTEMLADAAGTPDVAMMFVGGGLRVVLLTIHRSLRSVPDAVTGTEVARIARLVHRELVRYGVPQPRIALCGLNPHAGEGGLFGDEERSRVGAGRGRPSRRGARRLRTVSRGQRCSFAPSAASSTRSWPDTTTRG